MISLAHPWLLALAAFIPLIWWAYLSPRRRAAIRFSGAARLAGDAGAFSRYGRHILPTLRTLSVALLVLSLARPQKADEETKVSTEGVALQLVVDRSSSMIEQDFIDQRGRPQTRFDAVKSVVRQFVAGDGDELKGRENDLVGLIVFAHYADTECPLTHDHKHLLNALKLVEVPSGPDRRDEDGTAIGDALLLAIERTREMQRRFEDDDNFKITSRAIILLTDGDQNRGKYEPAEAAEAAAAVGVKIYTIGAAPDFQNRQMGFFGTRRVPVEVNEEELQKVAELTGGKYFRARDAESLKAIYAEIDKMERSKIDKESYFRYEELAYRWAELGPVKLPPPLLVALLLLALEIVLANTRLRRIP